MSKEMNSSDPIEDMIDLLACMPNDGFLRPKEVEPILEAVLDAQKRCREPG